MGQSVGVVHNFRQDLAYSLDADDESFWDNVYRKAFPNLVSHELCKNEVWQRAGVDRIIKLSNGRTLCIDEKKRRNEYGDILLEYISNDVYQTPGWMEKDLAINYLAYAFMQTRRCYIFDWPILRMAWLRFKGEWMKTYCPISSKNDGYKTISLPIPVNVLLNAISQSILVLAE